MRIRDAHATINGDKTEYAMPSGALDIIADDGKDLFSIALSDDGSIRISAGAFCKHGGVILEDRLYVRPVASNVVTIHKPKYKKEKQP